MLTRSRGQQSSQSATTGNSGDRFSLGLSDALGAPLGNRSLRQGSGSMPGFSFKPFVRLVPQRRRTRVAEVPAVML